MKRFLFDKPIPSLKPEVTEYPAWEISGSKSKNSRFYKLTSADFNISNKRDRKTENYSTLNNKAEYYLIQNDSTQQSLVWLTMARNIFHHQLSQMPEVYISRLVFNDKHKTVILLIDGQIIGAICFNPFPERDFAEIAFCVVNSTSQIQGYGSHIMARVKTYLQTLGLHNILTYADNTAIGYFQRQGFTLEIKFDPQKWRHCIKDYQGATLIHCSIRPDVDYLHLYEIVEQQKKFVSSLLPECEVSSETVFPIKTIRGIRITEEPNIDPINFMRLICTKAMEHSRAWPFLKPVSEEDVPNYRQFISKPMDFSTLVKNIDDHKYSTMKQFEEDLRLIFSNCYTFNDSESVYVKSAKELESYVEILLKKHSAGRLSK